MIKEVETPVDGRGSVNDPEMVWTPSSERIARAQLTSYRQWLAGQRGLRFGNYDELWSWSVGELGPFWRSVVEYFHLDLAPWRPGDPVLTQAEMPGATWFPNACVSYSEAVLSRNTGADPAIVATNESDELITVSWDELRSQVASVANSLRQWGVSPGDRVAGCLPNVAEAVVAFLASASVGAIWTACSPELGTGAVAARFSQVQPRVLFIADGYHFGGRRHDRRSEAIDLLRALPTVEHAVHVSNLGNTAPVGPEWSPWRDLLDQGTTLLFERVAFDHPLWILYSSGTTGVPKAIVHSHGGILLEHHKFNAFHLDLGPSDRFMWHTTTSWMVWNVLVSGLLTGASIVLYDGSPAHPNQDRLWQLADSLDVTFLGVGAAYLTACDRAGLRIGDRYPLRRLRSVGSTGSPLPASAARWLFEGVRSDLWLNSTCGGTDVCTGFVGGVPTLPVSADAMQARCLGADVAAYNPAGRSVIDEVGEFVVRKPMPSMPIGFWADDQDARYRASYFDRFPGVWSHGDWVTINEFGGVVVSGRSDATLNRFGVRIGPAEIYDAVDVVAGVHDSLVVGAELEGADYLLVLFVCTDDGVIDEAMRKAICAAIRSVSPRHVPDQIVAVPGIPRTHTGKKLEIPVKRLLQGVPLDHVVDLRTVAEPGVMSWFAEWAQQRTTIVRHQGG